MSKLKVLFFGTPDFSVPTLQNLIDDSRFEVCAVVTQPDRPAGRGQKLQISPVKALAQKFDIPILQPDKIKLVEQDFLNELSKFGAIDFGVVIAFGQILPIKTLNYPKFGCINIHASLLPRWRGAAPIQRSLLAGDTETGICIMQMEAGLDTGPVFSSQSTPINFDDNAQSLHDRLSVIGAQLLPESLVKIAAGEIQAAPQTLEGISYAQKITGADLQINWSDPTHKILLQIRTFSPKPAAFTTIDSKRLKIIKAEYQACETGNAAEIITTEKNSLLIKTSDAAIRVFELQIEGKKVMSVDEFLRGYGTVLNKKLG